MSGAVTIHVKFTLLPGHVTAIDVSDTDTVKSVTAEVASKLGVEAEDITLHFDGYILDDMKDEVRSTLLTEGSEVEVRPSKQYEARLVLKDKGLGWEGDCIRQTVATCDTEDDLEPIVQLMIDAGAGVGQRGMFGGRTPLHEASQKGFPRVATTLIAAGADMDALNSAGMSALHEASRKGHAEVVRYLLSIGANSALTDSHYERAALHDASLGGHLDVVKYLVGSGADPNAKTSIKRTPLHGASLDGHLEVVQFLLSAGANVNASDWREDKPLHEAASEGRLEVAKCLVGAGAAINAVGEYKNTPLHRASSGGHFEVAEYLVSCGAHPGAKDQDGETPAQVADKATVCGKRVATYLHSLEE